MIWNVKQKRDFVSFINFNFISYYFFFSILDDIHQGVTRLKMLALHMNQELDNQKPLMARLDTKIGALTDDVSKKNKNMKEILLR